jgi:hypothetical protein
MGQPAVKVPVPCREQVPLEIGRHSWLKIFPPRQVQRTKVRKRRGSRVDREKSTSQTLVIHVYTPNYWGG